MLQDNEGNRKIICYYAHCMLAYNTQKELDDIKLLESLGFEVINPNSKDIQDGYKMDRNIDRMAYFKQFVDKSDIIVFRTFNDVITSGVGYELKYAIEIGKPIIELPDYNTIKSKILSYADTKYLFNIWKKNIN